MAIPKEKTIVLNLLEICDELSDLFAATGRDWELNLHHTLTEPTCPTAVITPEGWDIARYRCDFDSIDESIRKAVDLVKAEVLGRRVEGSYSPVSDPDDDAYLKWLYARAAGSDEQLPEPPGKTLPEAFEWVVDGWLARHLDDLRERLDQRTQLKPSTLCPSDHRGRIDYMVGYITRMVEFELAVDRLDYAAAHDLVRRKILDRTSE